MASSQEKRASSARWWSGEDVLLLILVGVLYLLPGLGRIPLFDRDEPRFAVAARTMGQTGDYIVPHFNGALRPDKPPLVYWLMNLGYAATGGWGELGARLPSACSGMLTLVVVYLMVGSRFGRVTGIVAAMMLGSCALFAVESRMATADGTMLLCITVCMACAWQAWESGTPTDHSVHLPRADYLLDRSGDKSRLLIDQLSMASRRMPGSLALLFWIALAAGTLTKGVPLAFVLIPMIVLSFATGRLPAELRQWRSHFHLKGVRLGIALSIAVLAAGYLIVVSSAQVLADTWLWAVILGLVAIGMMLLPGLPAVLARCFVGANWGWWRQLRPLIGIPLLIVLVAWWVIWAGMATDWKLIKDMVGTHFLLRVAGPLPRLLGLQITSAGGLGANDPAKSPGNPPGTYLVAVWATFWPWCVLLVPAAYHTVRRLRKKSAIAIDPRPYQFLVAWVVPMWIALELARGKLLHYPLPLYVGLAILCADTLVQSWNRLTDVLHAGWFAAMRWISLLIWMGMGAVLLWGANHYLDAEWCWRCVPFAAALMATGFASATCWGRQSWPFVLVLTWGGALLVGNSMILPELPMLQVSRTLGRQMLELHRQEPGLHLASRGYDNATLVYYAGSNIEMFGSVERMLAKVRFAPVASTGTAATMAAVTVTAPEPVAEHYLIAVDDKTLADLDARHLQWYPELPRVTGLDVGNFHAVGVTLITNVAPDGYAATASMPATAEAPAASLPAGR